MKKAKIVLIISIVLFLGLLAYYFYLSAGEVEPVVSQREVYQQMLKDQEKTD